MNIGNKTGVFFRAMAVGDTEFRQSTDPKQPHAYVTPCAAGRSFGDAVQKVNEPGDLVDRRGNPIRRFKAGDVIEGAIEPRYDNGKRIVDRWTFTTFPDEKPASKPAIATGLK